MDLENKIRTELRVEYGDFTGFLENQYEIFLINKLITSSWKRKNKISEKEKWLTYNQVVLEIKKNINDNKILGEIQYRLTNGENPTNVCTDIIKKIKNKTTELERLYYKIISF
jgi:hypothetical protein